MRALCRRVLISSLAVLALGCSKEPKAEPEIEHVKAPGEAPPPTPAQFREPQEVNSDAGQAAAKRTPEELRELIAPSETPPPMPTDHRLHLGIDGDPGYVEDELTPEELAAARAAGAAVPQPTYAPQPGEPSRAEPYIGRQWCALSGAGRTSGKGRLCSGRSRDAKVLKDRSIARFAGGGPPGSVSL